MRRSPEEGLNPGVLKGRHVIPAQLGDAHQQLDHRAEVVRHFQVVQPHQARTELFAVQTPACLGAAEDFVDLLMGIGGI